MKKNVVYVVASFFTVICIILLGVNIIFRTKTIPELERSVYKKQEKFEQQVQTREKRIIQLEKELTSSVEKQRKAENDLKEKLAEEERIVLEKAQAEEDARIAAEKLVAEQARAAADEEASKKSEAS